MKRKTAAAVLACMMAVSLVPSAIAEEQTENNAVSGYVSLDSGVKIAGKDVTPLIHIDGCDYEGVLLAAADLAEDIEAVTGKKAEIAGADTGNEPRITALDSDKKTMTVANYDKLEKAGRGIIAVYNGEMLAEVRFSENTADSANGTLVFDDVPEMDGKQVKCFLWEDGGELTMNPLAPVYTPGEADNAIPEANIIAGTLGCGGTVDKLAAEGALGVSEIEGKWEAFAIREYNGQIIIAGSDERGTIYGIYDLSEKMGVSPWAWWADAVPAKAEELYIDLPEEGYTEGESSVKYRGLFLNDEYNFNKWSEAYGDGNMNPETYDRVYELILRLKANTMWPAMHAYSNGFHTNPESAELASKRGVVIGSSHAEPLLRNNLSELDSFQDEWEKAHPDKTLYKALENESGKKVAYYWTDRDNSGNHVDNKEFLEDYWRESVREYGQYENIYTLGMRGVHDGSFQTNMDYAEALNEIIACQYNILKEEAADKQGKDIRDIPKVFIPYKDIQPLYNRGELEIPDDVTIMWTDDNYGYMRQNADDAERVRAGRAGVYYHVSYYGWPTSYLWLSTTQPGLIREELTKAYDTGADMMWILNMGDMKPAEKEVEYFTKLARNIDYMRSADISEVYKRNAKRDFNMNDVQAAEYADIMDKFYELANSKRPDFFRSDDGLYGTALSVTAYGDEAERYINEYKNITERAEALYDELDEEKRAAFFELALYPIRSSKNMAVNYIQTSRADLYTEQGRGNAGAVYTEEAKAAAEQIKADIEYYNTMLDGKWAGMANINPEKLQSCDAHITLDLSAQSAGSLDYTELEVMTDSQTEYSGKPSMTVSAYDPYDKFIDVINKGYGSFEYTITADSDALVFDKTSGTAYGSDRVRVGVDKSKAPEGISEAVVTVTRLLGGEAADSKNIDIIIENPSGEFGEKTYIEAGGTVSVEAEHYSRAQANGVYEWKTVKDFGRSGDTVKAYPELADTVEDGDILSQSAYLEYDVYFTNAGTYTWDVYRMPTLNERGSCRVAAALDGGAPNVLRGTSTYSGSRDKNNAWSKGVLMNSEKLSCTVEVKEPGLHTLRLYNVSPSVVIDKMTLSLAPVNSYFGAPESYNTTYNTTKLETVSTAEREPAKEAQKAFEPKVFVGNTEAADGTVKMTLYKLDDAVTDAVVIAAGYDELGNMTCAGISDVVFGGKKADAAVRADIADAAAYAVYVVDSLENMIPVAPFKVSGDIISENTDSYIGIKADLEDYFGKKAVTVIADTDIATGISAENIKYICGETLDRDSFKYMPFNEPGGVYYIRTGIDGGTVFDETRNTTVNIMPDNDGVEETLNKWDFEGTLESGADAFVLSGGASLEDEGYVKLNKENSGSMAVRYSEPIAVPQGETLTVEFDITFGKLINRTVSYEITDGSGNTLTSAKLCAYDLSTAAEILIGGTNVAADPQVLSGAISRSQSTADQNKPTHFKYVIDFESGRVHLTVGAEDKEAVEYSGRLAENSGTLGGISISTNYDNNERACRVDNVSVSTTTAPQYKILFAPQDAANGRDIAAAVTVTDGSTGAVIAPEADGSYMLCEGIYGVFAQADGYRNVDMDFELTPALESKTAVIPMQSVSELTPAGITIKFVDENGTEIADSKSISGYYTGDRYSVPEEYRQNIIARNGAGAAVYTIVPEKSQLEMSALEENNTFSLVFRLSADYTFFEDFENYTADGAAWHGTKNMLSVSDGARGDGLLYTSNGNTIGAYCDVPVIDLTGKTALLEADIKFAPAGTAGNSQFAVGAEGGKLTFDGGTNIDWGAGDNGFALLIAYNGGKTLEVNGSSVPTSFIGSWMHIKAELDFAAQTLNIIITNDSGERAEFSDMEFHSVSAVNEIGAIYLRAAKTNGTVGVDNVTITELQ